MNSSRRAVITGLGPIACIGEGKQAFLDALLDHRQAITPVKYFDTGNFKAKRAGHIDTFDSRKYFDAKRIKRLDRYAQIALVSATLAITDSGLTWPDNEPQLRYGVSFGTALGGISNAEEEHTAFLAQGSKGVNKSLALMVFGGSAHANIAIEFGFRGVGTTNSNSCASGTVAIGDALRFIREDIADVVIAGGAEAPLSPLTFGAFDFIRTMSTVNTDNAYRPFDRQRDGFIMGEGGASLVIEEYQHAKQRGAHIYAEILGYSLNNDAFHMTSPRPDGEAVQRVMRAALDNAQVRPEQINYINAHASGTQLNDSSETAAIRAVFGSHSNRLQVSGTKPYTAHPLGATGAMEAVICALAIDHGFLPPTLNFETPDPACDLDIIANECRAVQPHLIMSNSFGFGGINASLIMSAC